MKTNIKILVIVSSLLLFMTLFFPIWQIRLEAPQYPTPLGLNISVDKIEGMEDNDLENINLLNHYIGMKEIVADSIPELKFLKYVFYFFILFGIVVLFSKHKAFLFGWVVAMTIAGTLLLWDFNKWEKDYGTNLDPTAAIKVEGMTYKPPLIGKKELLNITAYSYPYSGGIAFFTSILVAWGAFFIAMNQSPVEESKKISLPKLTAKRKTFGVG
ncbi:MAG: hypothetical protein HYU67_11650 [Flavobacteriia bacterium]|nr:hypothetical protein [Flavobacteriia bacterium]